MAESSPKVQETLWEKEKLLVISTFSFSHRVFKRIILQTLESKGLFWKGLILNRLSALGKGSTRLMLVHVSFSSKIRQKYNAGVTSACQAPDPPPTAPK